MYAKKRKTSGPGSGPGSSWGVGKVVSVPRAVPQRAFVTQWPPRGGAGRGVRVPQELKFFDTAISFTADATGEVPATGQLTLIPQGDGESSRDGRMAYIKSVLCRLIVSYAPGAAATAATNVFLFLVQDMQANGAAAAVTDVMTSTNLAQALHNLSNAGRFRVIKKWRINLTAQAGATTAYNNTIKSIDWYKQLDIPVSYSGASGAITEIKSNNLFLMCGTDGASDDLVTVGGNFRLRFYD